MGIRVWNYSYIGDPFRLPQAFVITEEKRAVFFDWSANGESKLVALERGLSISVGIVFPSCCVESTVPEKLINCAVELVRSGFGDHVHDAPARSAEFGTVVCRQHLKLANSVNTQESAARATRCSEKSIAVDFHAVQKPAGLVWTRSGDRHSRSKTTAHFSCTRIAQGNGRGLDERQLRKVSSSDLQFSESLFFDDARNGALGRLNYGSIPCDDHLFANASNFHRQCQTCLLAYRQCQSFAQLRKVSAIEGQFSDSLFFDDARNGALGRLNYGSIPCDDHLFANASNFHRQCQTCLLAYRQCQ